jgi:hypothetical protein
MAVFIIPKTTEKKKVICSNLLMKRLLLPQSARLQLQQQQWMQRMKLILLSFDLRRAQSHVIESPLNQKVLVIHWQSPIQSEEEEVIQFLAAHPNAVDPVRKKSSHPLGQGLD